MYKVTINGIEREIEAKGLTVDNGTLIFFSNEEQTQSRIIVAAGKWDSLEVMEESNALQINKTASIPQNQQAGSGEEVRQGLETEEEATRKAQAEAQEAK